MPRAILYTRVSTDEQNKGYSPEDQKAKLIKYCEDRNIEIEKIYHDDASAKSFERPEWKRIIEFVRSNPRKVDLFLFIKWDRFSRNAPEAYEAIKLLNNLKVEPIAIEQPLDLNIPENKLMLAIYLAAPEAENDRRALNVIAGMRRAKKSGRWLGRCPRGYKNSRDQVNKPIIVPEGGNQQQLVVEAFSLFASGLYSIEEVRTVLKRRGLKCTRSSFWQLLRNKGYIGQIFIPSHLDEPEEWINGLHEPLIDEDTFYNVQDILEGRQKKVPNKYLTVKEEYPLRGFLTCQKCGGKITASASKGRSGKKFHYYHCTKGCKERHPTELINSSFIEFLKSLKPNSATQEVYIEFLKEKLKAEMKIAFTKKDQIISDINRQNGRLKKLNNLILDNEINPNEYREMKLEIDSKLIELQNEMTLTETISKSDMEGLRFCFEHLKNIDKLYQASDIEIKQRMLNAFFKENLVFEIDAFRTPKMNSALELIISNSGLSRRLNKKSDSKFESLSMMVGNDGFEPPTSCL
jgi:site-specific DNA recombinase